MLVPEAAKLKKKRWALVYPELRVRPVGGRRLQGAAEEGAARRRVRTEQAPPLGKVDAGAVVQALADAKPDAIFNVLFGADLSKFVREGNTRGAVQGPRRWSAC